MLLDYLATYSNAVLHYKASEMYLHINTDAVYLVAPGANNHIAGYFYLGANNSTSLPQASTINAPTHVICKFLKHVVSSTTEAETDGLFVNYQETIPIRHMLTALNQP